MVSAVNIDGLDKEELREHFFNDVKYATISLDKDLKQIYEKYESSILKIDFISIKKRIQEEYSDFVKSTYGFLDLSEFPMDQKALAEYLIQNREQLQLGINSLSDLCEYVNQISRYGLKQEWTYQELLEFAILFEQIDEEFIPTKYWFDLKKYDFIQELMNEAQTKIEEFLFSDKRILQSWNPQVLEGEKVAALDYYIERKGTGLKLFDLSFHKCKKILKEMFIDEARTFGDSEIEELHKHVYIYKKNDYWIQRNQTRLKQFLGAGYKGTETDFAQLRAQYAISYKLSAEYTTDEERKNFIASMIEEESYNNLSQLVVELHKQATNFDFHNLLRKLPCEIEVIEHNKMESILQVVRCFYQLIDQLSKDYDTICSYRLQMDEEELFQVEELRKVIYIIERVVQKQDWLKKHQAKIKELFRNEELSMETDWSALREKIFHTDIKKCFQVYENVDKTSYFEQSGGQNTLQDILSYVLYMECPIKEEVIYKRIVTLMEAVRLTPKMKLEIQALLQNELSCEYEIDGDYIYAKNEKSYILRLPKEGERREIDLIAPREVKAGIMTILDIHYEMTMDDIGKELAKLLGYPRRTKKYNDIFEGLIKELQREGLIKRFSGGFRIEK